MMEYIHHTEIVLPDLITWWERPDVEWYQKENDHPNTCYFSSEIGGWLKAQKHDTKFFLHVKEDNLARIYFEDPSHASLFKLTWL